MSGMDEPRRTLAGRYELLEVLGRGGMGVVYRANDLVLHRTVAVKVLPAVLAQEQPTHVARFEREARAAASLMNPNVVAVFDTGIDEATRFIAMEYVNGASLAAILGDQAPLAPDRALKIGEQVADALAAAHAAGLIHRDVKPANVMLDEDGSVKVLDFGIARGPDHTTLTQEQSVLGSAAYMAPEQARGERADERSDIYSLGCLLYAMLTGRPPFGGDSAAAVLHQQVNANVRPPRQTNRSVSPALDALVMAMLAKSPARRPQSAAQVRAQLAALQAPAAVPPGRPAPARAPRVGRAPTAVTRVLGDTAVTRAIAAIRPRRRAQLTVAAVAGCVVLLALVLLLAGGGSSPSAQRGSTAARRTPKTVSTAKATTTAKAAAPRAATSSAAASTPSVAEAASALASLIAQDLQAGSVAQPAARQITKGLGAILGPFGSGNALDAQRRLGDLAQLTSVLEGRGEIGQAAVAPLNVALGSLGAALVRSAPAEASGSPAQPPGHGGERHGHAKKDGGGHGD
jgi:hypothetical protein